MGIAPLAGSPESLLRPRGDAAVRLCATDKMLFEEAEEDERQQSLFHLVWDIEGLPSLLTAQSCSDDA